MVERIKEVLISKGLNILEVIPGQIVGRSRLEDYSGNPHTVSYFIHKLGLLPAEHELDYSPDNAIDVEIILGAENAIRLINP